MNIWCEMQYNCFYRLYFYGVLFLCMIRIVFGLIYMLLGGHYCNLNEGIILSRKNDLAHLSSKIY